jgi:hypothetical protein
MSVQQIVGQRQTHGNITGVSQLLICLDGWMDTHIAFAANALHWNESPWSVALSIGRTGQPLHPCAAHLPLLNLMTSPQSSFPARLPHRGIDGHLVRWPANKGSSTFNAEPGGHRLTITWSDGAASYWPLT